MVSGTKIPIAISVVRIEKVERVRASAESIDFVPEAEFFSLSTFFLTIIIFSRYCSSQTVGLSFLFVLCETTKLQL